MRKLAFCIIIYKNKGADQLCGARCHAANQDLCFYNMDSIILLLSK